MVQCYFKNKPKKLHRGLGEACLLPPLTLDSKCHAKSKVNVQQTQFHPPAYLHLICFKSFSEISQVINYMVGGNKFHLAHTNTFDGKSPLKH